MRKKRLLAGISTAVIAAPLLYLGIQNYRLQNSEAYQIGLLYRESAPKTADFMLKATSEAAYKADPPTCLLSFASMYIPDHFSPADKKHLAKYLDDFLFIPAKDQDKQHQIVKDFRRGAAPYKSYWDMLKPL